MELNKIKWNKIKLVPFFTEKKSVLSCDVLF